MHPLNSDKNNMLNLHLIWFLLETQQTKQKNIYDKTKRGLVTYKIFLKPKKPSNKFFLQLKPQKHINLD